MTEAKNKTRILTECALMVAISAVLQLIPPMQMPQGGSLTFGAMVPIVFISLRHGVKWGLLTAFVGSLIQMLLGGISAPPTETFWWFLLVILLDYVIAYTVLGLASVFAKPFMANHPLIGAGTGAACVTVMRYICHIISGILIWGVYAPEGTPVWLHSILYNGSYMIPEIIITTAVTVLLWKYIELRPKKAVA
ncbi:MAG: energy-coupled thiamine transporter ThiT [Hydrogenoanaerobacterium sp.]